MGRIRLFPLLFQNGCSQSSRFSTAGQGERGSGNEIDKQIIPTCKAYAHCLSLHVGHILVVWDLFSSDYQQKNETYEQILVTCKLLVREHRLLTIFSHYPKSSDRREDDVNLIHDVAIQPLSLKLGLNDLFLSQNKTRVEQHGYNFLPSGETSQMKPLLFWHSGESIQMKPISRASVVRKVNNAIQRIAWFVLFKLIHWTASYLGDSVIHLSNNPSHNVKGPQSASAIFDAIEIIDIAW